MTTYNPKESSKEDVRTFDSDGDQDNYWDKELLRAVQRRVGKSEKEPEKVTLDRVKIALNEGANINVQNHNGDTALQLAIKKDFRQTVEFLLQIGAETDINNSIGETAMNLAESLQKKNIIGVLKKHVERRNEPGVGRSSGADIVSVADEQESSTSRGGAMVIQRKLDTAEVHSERIGSREGSDSNEHPETANKVPGSQVEKTFVPNATLTASWLGIVYQLQHLEFTLHCALQLKDPSFYLATEMEEAVKLDDVVLRYKSDDGKQVGRFVQIKHASNEESTISAKELLDAGGNFSVPSYFISWRKVKRNKLFDDIRIRHMILCTNRGLDSKELTKNQIHYRRAEDPDELFELKSELKDDMRKPAWYKFQADMKSNKKLYDELKRTSNGQKLAKLLATHICDKKDLRLNMEMFGLYHVALKKHVFDPTSKKFHDDFINNKKLSKNVENFRKAFLSEFREKRNDIQINTSEANVWDEIKNLFSNLNLPKKFGESSEPTSDQSTNRAPKSDPRSELPDDDYVGDKEIEDFLEEFTLAVNQPGSEELSTLIGHKIHSNSRFNLLNPELLDDIVLTKLLKWFVQKGDRGKRKKYLSYKLSEEFIKSINDEVDSLLAKGAIPVYCEWITKYDVHFKSGMQQVKDFLAADGSNSTSKRVLNLVAPEETLLIALKVYDTLKLIPKYVKSDSFIFTRVDSLKLPSNSVKTIFHSQRYPDLLIVDCGSNGTEKYLQTLLNPLYEIVAENAHKKMIVITRQGENLDSQFDLGCETCLEKIENLSFDNLTNDSQKKLLGKQVTKFQGRNNKTSFGKLLGVDDCDNLREEELKDISDIMDSDILVKLISGDEIQIGGDVKGLDEIEHYYIHRTIFRHVVIKKDILEDVKIPDLFAISGKNRVFPAKPFRMEQTFSITRNVTPHFFVHGGIDIDVPSESVRSGETSLMAHSTKNFTFLDNNREEEQFDALCAENENRNVHWLQRKQDIWGKEEYVWKKSRGNITSLVKYRAATESENIDDRTSVTVLSEDDLTSHDEPVIISDAAGMGKSTMLTYLASNMKKKEPDMLVLKIDLNQHATALGKVEEDSSYVLGGINKAVQFLVKELLSGETNLVRKVYERIIKRKRKVALVFDGFDEISPDYEHTVIDLLETLAKYGIKKLVVSTRPHTRETLETKLNAFSHEIKPFSTHDQERFLTDYWKAKFEDSGDNSRQRTEHRIKEYVTAIVKKLADWIDDQENKFTGNPLQAYLVAEIFGNQREEAPKPFDTCKDFINSEVDEPKFPKKIDLIYLYEHFVNQKFDVFFKKTGVNTAAVLTKKIKEKYFKEFVEKHERLALYALFDKNEIKELLLSQRNWSHGSLKIADDDIVEQDGIVTQLIGGQPVFGHRTYAEYFAAKFFIETLKTCEQNESLVKVFVGDILLGCNFETMRAFIDWLFENERVDILEGEFWPGYVGTYRQFTIETIFHVAAAEGNGQILRLFLNYFGANTEDRWVLIHFKDIFGRTAVHRAVEYGHLDKIQLLIDGTNFDVDSQDLFGVTSLHVAARCCELDVVKYLLQKGADINLKVKNGSTPLHYAAVGGKLDVVLYLVGKGADINSQHEDGSTPLHAAALEGNLNVVEYLVGKGADINSPHGNGWTPLHAAAQEGKLNVVEYLVGKGADINSQHEDGSTPLHFAALKGKLDVVEYLIAKGADINSRQEDGWTPLHAAAPEGKLNVVEYLVSKGADINSRHEDGSMPLHAAALKGQLHVVKYLVGKGADINSRDKNGWTPLHIAATEGKLNVVKYLISKGADINSRQEDGSMPLHAAALEGELNVVKYLVSKGAEINSPDMNGWTPLHAAAQEGKLNVIEYLLSKGTDINLRTKNGSTPLHAAALEGELNVVKYLVSKGAEINSPDMNGSTPLHAAAQEGQLNVIEHLLVKGADINSQNQNGWTPLHAAANEGKLNAIEYLLGEGADINFQNKYGSTPLHAAALEGELNVVEYLVGKGAEINSSDMNGLTPLHAAAQGGKLNVIEYLLGKGADINSQNQNGWTPLHVATQEGKLNVIEYLVGKGVDINSRDKDGLTLLHIAALEGRSNAVEYLVSEGADINSQDMDGLTPLHIAALEGKLNIVEYLAGKGADGNLRHEDGSTLLDIAPLEEEFCNLVEYLVGKEADINVHEVSSTLLHIAALEGELNEVEYLVGKGADINFRDENGVTPLHIAALKGKLNIVEYLVGQGAGISSQDMNGWTPLRLAVEAEQWDVTRYLLSRKANG